MFAPTSAGSDLALGLDAGELASGAFHGTFVVVVAAAVAVVVAAAVV